MYNYENQPSDTVMKTLNSLADVVKAVNDGHKVYWKTTDYHVSVDLYGTYNIVYRPWSRNPNTVGLFHLDGVSSDYSPSEFMVN